MNTNDSSGISSPELFFDLIFSFAVSQLSSHLFHHFNWKGLAETLVMMIAVLLVWIYTSWSATWIQVRFKSTKWMLLVVLER
jgi:low temperature requirement protein LtrA